MDRENAGRNSADLALVEAARVKAPNGPIVVSVCVTCKTADSGAVVGPDMFRSIKAAIGPSDHVQVRPVQCLSVCKRPATVGACHRDGGGRLQTLRHCTGRTCTWSDEPIAALTDSSMSGPTTVPLSAVLQVMQTLTTMGPLGTLARVASTDAKSAEFRPAFSRSITGSLHGRQATSFVGSRRRLIAIGSLPSGAPRPTTPPKHSS